jgi:hypothetical protein
MSANAIHPRVGRPAGALAVVLGVLGVLVAWVPVWSLGVVLLGPLAIGLGLAGVMRKGRTARPCWVGLGLGLVSIVMAFSWPLVYR